MQLEYLVNLDTTLKDFLLYKGFSKNVLNIILNQKQSIYINNVLYKDDYHLHCGDTVKVVFFDEDTSVKPVNKPIDIIYEDDFFIVLNKPKNLATIPTMARFDDNLASRLKHYYDSKNLKIGIHCLTRLDYETSGITLFCKHQIISNQLKNIKYTKLYSATVCGKISPEKGLIDKPILKVGKEKKRIIDDQGKESKTEYELIKYNDNNTSDIKLHLLTGRTHQIRIHLASIGFPLVGDPLYGNNECENFDFNLKCYSLSFYFPLNGKHYEFLI